MYRTWLGRSLFSCTETSSIIYSKSDLPLGKGWIQGDCIVLDFRPMGPIFLMWIGQTLWIMECTLHVWDPAIFLVSSSLNHSWHIRLAFGYGLDSRWWYITGYWIDGSNIFCVDRADPVGRWMDRILLGRSHFLSTIALWITKGISDLPLVKGWIQGDGKVLHIGTIGPIFLVWIGHTRESWNGPCVIGSQPFSFYSSSLNH